MGPGGYDGASTSLGATSSAPRTLWIEARGDAAQCATSAQPRLCAASTTGRGAAATAVSSVRTQSSRRGVSQSDCTTRTQSPRSRSQYDCQFSGPEFHRPGTTKTFGIMTPPSSARRFLHERAYPCLFGGGQLLQREGGRPHVAFVEVRLVAEAERRVPRLE